jgi:hypothetical protein
MYFVLYVVTPERPTNEVLQKALEPFRGVHWSEWQLGGPVCGGNIVPKQFDDRIMGESNTENGGVDAARMDNIDHITNVEAFALVIRGQWHQCDIVPTEDDGIPDNRTDAEKDAEDRAIERWQNKCHDLVADLCPSCCWVSIVEFKNMDVEEPPDIETLIIESARAGLDHHSFLRKVWEHHPKLTIGEIVAAMEARRAKVEQLSSAFGKLNL